MMRTPFIMEVLFLRLISVVHVEPYEIVVRMRSVCEQVLNAFDPYNNYAAPV